MATIRLIEDQEGFEGLKAVWDRLYSANPNLRVFQSFDWNLSVWNTYHKAEWPNDRLYIVHATRDGHEEQEVILPFCLENGSTLRFIGSYPSDVLDAVCRVHEDNWNGFYGDIFGFIGNDRRVKRVALTKMEPSSEVLEWGGGYERR